jgi:hypothetical protein
VLRIRTRRIRMFLGLLDPDPFPLVGGMDLPIPTKFHGSATLNLTVVFVLDQCFESGSRVLLQSGPPISGSRRSKSSWIRILNSVKINY